MKKKTVDAPATRSREYWMDDAAAFAALYTSGGSPFSRIVSGFLRDRSRILARMVGAGPYRSALDVGCGSGVHMAMLLSVARHVSGIDYSPGMVEDAKKTLAGYDRKRWDVHVSDAASLPYDDRSFNLVIAMGLLDYVPSPAAVLVECRRVMADGATLVVSLPKDPSLFGMLRTGPGNFVKKHLFNLPPIDNALTRDGLATLCSSSGFTVTDTADVWDAMWMVRATAVRLPRGNRPHPRP